MTIARQVGIIWLLLHAVVIKPRIYKSNIDARGGIKLINPGVRSPSVSWIY